MKKHYDIIAIGAGSGGLSAVKRANEYDKKCAVIEANTIGGTCVNLGCVPKKIMWLAANTANTINNAKRFGFNAKLKSFSWKALKQGKDGYIKSITDWYDNDLKKSGIDYIHGFATLVDKNTVMVNSKQYTADYIVLSTGSKPIIPNIKGAQYGITSDDFFKLEHLPKKIAIIGGGYIGVELAGVLNSLGAKVTMFIRSNTLLRGFDSMLQEMLNKYYKAHGIKIHYNCQINKLSNDRVYTDKNEFSGFDTIIWTVGRSPMTEQLGLNKVGIKTDKNGFVPTDKFQTTQVANIFALGDITGRAPLTPVAIAAGRNLSDRLFNNMKGKHLDYNNIPSVVFAHPPIGTIGLTENKANNQYTGKVTIYQSSFIPMTDALLEQKSTTAIKLVCVGKDEKIVGCHIIGHSADEMLQGFAVAIKMGASKQQFDETIAIHPSSSEELVTMR